MNYESPSLIGSDFLTIGSVEEHSDFNIRKIKPRQYFSSATLPDGVETVMAEDGEIIADNNQ